MFICLFKWPICLLILVPPFCRVCVQARLPVGHLLQMDVLLHDWSAAPEEDCFQHRDTLHVQSISHWAPANIGPYSQAVQVILCDCMIINLLVVYSV